MKETTERPRVALIAHDIHDHGGMERAFAELIRHVATEYRIVVVSATLDESLRSLVDWRRVPTPPRPFAVKFCWFFLLGGLRACRLDVDIVHVLGAIVPTKADIACVQFCHAGFIEAQGKMSSSRGSVLRRTNSNISRWLALQAERWSYRPERLRALAAVSAGVGRELRKHYPTMEVAITPNGVDVARYHRDDVARQRIRQDEGVSDADRAILFVGGDWDRKGLTLAIQALSVARDRGIPARLWVVGRGEIGRFEQVAREHGVHDFVKFFGPRLKTESYFQAADVCVLPTVYETFSLVAYEAAATGVPIVATEVSGIDELLKGGVAGLTVSRDPQAIGSALVRLCTDEHLRKRLAATGERRAHEYTWEKAAGAVRVLYTELLYPPPRVEGQREPDRSTDRPGHPHPKTPEPRPTAADGPNTPLDLQTSERWRRVGRATVRLLGTREK